jgi:hypothetical protein
VAKKNRFRFACVGKCPVPFHLLLPVINLWRMVLMEMFAFLVRLVNLNLSVSDRAYIAVGG